MALGLAMNNGRPAQLSPWSNRQRPVPPIVWGKPATSEPAASHVSGCPGAIHSLDTRPSLCLDVELLGWGLLGGCAIVLARALGTGLAGLVTLGGLLAVVCGLIPITPVVAVEIATSATTASTATATTLTTGYDSSRRCVSQRTF